LFLIFLTLKLAEVGPVADWSWWWVTSPLWIPLALVGVIVSIVVGIAVIAHKLKK
jgi:small Trp-rich protein